MTSTLDLATATPAEIDTAWVEVTEPIHIKLDGVARRIANCTRHIEMFGATREDIREMKITLNAAQDRRDELNDELETVEAPFKAEWKARGGWTRAYKVTNTNGHIHSTTRCNTCFDTTQFAWITHLSGHTTDEIAELAGEMACTVCYPNAPVSKPCQIFTKDEEQKQADKVEREAKRAAKLAKQALNAITDVDGSPLLDSDGRVIKTIQTARIELNSSRWYMNSQNPKQAERMTAAYHRIIAAISAKTGVSVEELAAKVEKKYIKDSSF